MDATETAVVDPANIELTDLWAASAREHLLSLGDLFANALVNLSDTGPDKTITAWFGNAEDLRRTIALARILVRLEKPCEGPMPLREGAVEIHEHILGFLNARELRAVLPVSKRFRDIITGSPILQRSLCEVPRPQDIFFSPFASQLVHLHGLPDHKPPPLVHDSSLAVTCGWVSNGPEHPPEGTIIAEYDPERDLPRLGAASRNTLVCNPPVKVMDIELSCCRGMTRAGDYRGPKTVRNESGITVGQLLDLTGKFRKTHRLCPNADTYDLDARGFVWVRVRFVGDVELKWDDPVVQDEMRMGVRSAKRVEALGRYRHLKLDGKCTL